MMRMTALVFACASFVVGCSWGEGSGQDDPPGPDAGPSGGGVCGDGVCAANEVASCSADCGSGGGGGGGGSAICGNNTCETGESPTSCPNDCTSGGGGSGSGSGSATCPSPAPDISACAACIVPGSGTCPGGDLTGCITCVTGGGGGGLPGGNCNNDGVCDAGEDASCILDMCP